jgi:hypothetical protein
MSEVLASIPVELDADSLMKNARVQPESDDARVFQQLVDLAREVARPKAVYDEAYVEERGSDTVRIGSITFTSLMLAKNLAEVERVFPFVATCGHEMDQVELPTDDFLAEYWWDSIKAAVLGCATEYLNAHIKSRFRLEKIAEMHPGSAGAEVWPIQEQQQLFGLLGDVRGLIGVELTDSYLMIPNKSVSGIKFATERDFHSCQVCRKEHCPNRTVPFDEKLWAELSTRDSEQNSK